MKNNSLLNFEEQKKLFERFSVYTLESLEILYDVIEQDSPLSFRIVFKKKYEENRDNYEGRNEYTYSTKIDNFDISEITNSINDLTDQELAYITNPIFKTISTINPREEEIKIIPKLLEFQKAHEASITNRFTPIYKGMLPKDVKNFFLKFSLVGLEFFDDILDYCSDPRINDIKRVKNEALEIKHKRYLNNNASTLSTVRNFKLSQLQASFSSLTDIEIEFFHGLIDDAAMYLDCIQEYSDYYKEVIEDFNLNDYPINEVNKLLDLINKEINQRILDKSPTNIKTM